MNNKSINGVYTQKELYDNYIKNNKNIDDPIEWEYFIQFVKDHPHLKPYRTEWMIFDEDLKLAGSIDMIYENEDGILSIYDWKRSKEITKINNWNQYATNPLISHMPDTNFWHYALQLNTYKTILERKYGKKIKELYLVRLHPNTQDNTYELLEVPILEKEMNDLFEERKKEVSA
jgi:ATP-dependent exoDNAse (exonuclease V) beta subunit